MNSLQLLSAVYKFGIGCGIFTIKETIEFFDKVIEELDNPPYEIIEVAMMSKAKIDDIEDKLWEYHGAVDNEYVLKVALSLISKKYIQKEIDIKHAIRCTERLLIHTGFSFEDEYYGLYYLDDAYHLAENHIHHDLRDVVNSFEDNISKYDSYYKDYEEAVNEVIKQR
ncbi:hypothetical protein [Oceanirhabdus sp. W0125-5]|uniref:hypothetical protein n=1 Tax=Oceanirhabdus sp. W0125-5 TaxID=2999116 RepID=UPI0022F2D02D|nr:hypothetical protein [Oceanirhabdus sp. W0125-5]WBW98375.1 hypothetical protein OW730_06295 [Oceanirhabdus sp. W0125-5]